MISPEQAELFKKLNNRKCEAMFYPHFEYPNPKDKKVDVTKISYIHPIWLRRLDLNQRPSGYEPDELPTAPLRDIFFRHLRQLLYYSTPFLSCQEVSRKFFLLSVSEKVLIRPLRKSGIFHKPAKSSLRRIQLLKRFFSEKDIFYLILLLKSAKSS